MSAAARNPVSGCQILTQDKRNGAWTLDVPENEDSLKFPQLRAHARFVSRQMSMLACRSGGVTILHQADPFQSVCRTTLEIDLPASGGALRVTLSLGWHFLKF
jgi:hypothetical protein